MITFHVESNLRSAVNDDPVHKSCEKVFVKFCYHGYSGSIVKDIFRCFLLFAAAADIYDDGILLGGKPCTRFQKLIILLCLDRRVKVLSQQCKKQFMISTIRKPRRQDYCQNKKKRDSWRLPKSANLSESLILRLFLYVFTCFVTEDIQSPHGRSKGTCRTGLLP